MGIKTSVTQQLQEELNTIGKEIDKRIARLGSLSTEIDQCEKVLEDAVAEIQVVAEQKFRKSLMSTGEEVWDFAWDSVWQAVKNFEMKASDEIKNDYQQLVPTLKSKQSYLSNKLQISEMMGDQVWTEVWETIWSVIANLNGEFRCYAATEIERLDGELQSLLDKQLSLQTKLDKQATAERGARRFFIK